MLCAVVDLPTEEKSFLSTRIGRVNFSFTSRLLVFYTFTVVAVNDAADDPLGMCGLDPRRAHRAIPRTSFKT